MRCGDLLREAWVPRPAEAAKLSFRQHIRAWWQACRPPFFITAAIPVTLALALSFRTQGGVSAAQWANYALLLVGCFMGLTIANLANDLFDHILGVDGGDNIGGSRVIQSGLISPRQLSIALLLLTPGTLAVGGALIMGMPPALRPALWGLSIFAVASAVFYVAPPLRYGHRALGEVFVCLNMGFIMVGASTTLLLGRFEPRCLALALPVGLMVAGVLYYQSLPEIETDLAAGKHTVANRLGKRQAFLIFRLWWPAVWILLLNLWAAGLAGWPVALCLLGLPLHLGACRRIRAAGQGDWLPLDRHGNLVRKCYLISGAALILGVLL